MASIYHKGKSPVIWIRYKNNLGKWKGKPTSYRWSNIGEVRQAKLVARKQSEQELIIHKDNSQKLESWVIPWLASNYGHSSANTLDAYKRSWRSLMKYLNEKGVFTAAQIRREFIEDYLQWRKQTAGRNTAIGEIKLMSMIIEESIKRGHRTDNPLRKPKLKKEKAKEKEVWSNSDIKKAATHIEKHGTQWQKVAFYFGLYQACRLRQCQLPLSAIRFDLKVIQYPDELVKGAKGYSQPIDEKFLPILKGLVQDAKNEGHNILCKIPWDASLRFRKTFDRAGLLGLCHHGLRATWITLAAEAGVPESQAMAFCHHESREVHRVYKKLSSIGIAHVPSLLHLPDFRSGVSVNVKKRDSSTIRGNVSGSSSRRIQKRSPHA